MHELKFDYNQMTEDQLILLETIAANMEQVNLQLIAVITSEVAPVIDAIKTLTNDWTNKVEPVQEPE